MHRKHYGDTTSPARTATTTSWVVLRLAAITAIAFALVAASVSAAPFPKTSAPAASAASAPTATAAESCIAQIQQGSKLIPVYETYYKYAFKKLKGKKTYSRVVVKTRRKLKASCVRQCVRTKVVKKKRVPVFKTVKKMVQVKKGNRIVKQRKKVRVYTFEKCKITTGPAIAGTPVKITLLDGSYANLDFGAFQRQAPISGNVSGFIPGGYKLNQDAQINLTRGDMLLGQTDVFIDDDCGGKVSAAIRTGNPTTVNLNPTKQSISNLTAAGGVTATAYTRIRLPLELRNDDNGCDQPYIPTGYTEFDQTFFLKGRIEKGTGLNKLTLTSAPDPLDVEACLARGTPTSPCNNSTLIIPLPIIVSTHLVVSVKMNQ